MSSLESVVTVETPEQVSLSYTVAGVASRIQAALLDTIIIGLTQIFLWIMLYLLVNLFGFTMGQVTGLVSNSWLLAIVLFLQFAVTWGYYVLFEGLRDGQTPGKKRMGLRVVQDGGYSVSFAASAVRNLIRIIDFQPAPFALVGIISSLVSKSGKRLGDIVAGTFVVKESTSAAFDYYGTKQPQSSATGATAMLNADEYLLLERYVTRRQDLPADRRAAIMGQLRERFAAKVPPDSQMTDAKYLLWLFDRERAARSTTIASRSDTGSDAERNALASFGVQRWNEFDKWVARVRAEGLSKMPPDRISEFVARYREISADLARLQTASRGREIGPLFFVSRLVASAHNLIYRGKSHTISSVGNYFAFTLPAEVRRSAGPIMVATALFFIPAITSYFAIVRDPKIAEQVLPLEMLERASNASMRAARGEGYVTIDSLERPLAASSIISNNVGITYLVFAAGLTAGFGTVMVLVMNGVTIGGGAGIFTAEGMYELLLAFVAPHGVLELTAIVIAGGGGLLVASALLLPGALTRKDALVLKGRRAIRLIALSTVMLIVAGIIEGLISPRVWPLEWKLAVSMATALALVAYLMNGWRKLDDESYNPDLALISR